MRKVEHLSDSSVQGKIEIKIVKKLEKDHGCIFSKIRENSRFEFDFFNDEKKIIGEIYAGIDKLNPAQKKKVITDCFKLVCAEKKFGGEWNKYIVFVDEKIKNAFIGDSWISEAIKLFEIKLITVDLLPKELDELRLAKKRQQIGNHLIVGKQ